MGHGQSQADQGCRDRGAGGGTDAAGGPLAAARRGAARGDSGVARRNRQAQGAAAAAEHSAQHVECATPRSEAQEEAAGQAVRFGQASEDGRVGNP